MRIANLFDGRRVDLDKLAPGYRVKYGRAFRPGITLLQIELIAFREGYQAPFGLGKLGHFKKIVATVWPKYQWNEWSEEMAKALCMFDLVAFMGCAGSGKSLFLALWALVNWWAAPQDTAIAITSNSIEGAKTRVWGHIITAHRDAQWLDDNGVRRDAPGKVTDQPPKVRLSDVTDEVRGAGQEAIQLVAAGNANLDAALGTLQGMHNKLVILILDELQDLAAGIIGGVLENLTQNPRLQICAAGNIGNPDDPLGTLCRPVTPENRGYDDVNAETPSWTIQRAGMRGICVRFDAEHSPNFLYHIPGQPDKYEYLPQVWKVRQEREAMEKGEADIADYYRQRKAFIAPKNAEDGRYSAAAILKFKGGDPAGWDTSGGFVALGGCDPAYSAGGDRFVLFPIHYGLSGGLWTLEFQEPIPLQHDLEDAELRNYALAKLARRHCADRTHPITAERFGVDTSGENPIGDIFATVWESNEILRVNFQGNASDRQVSLTDKRPCADEYGNRCSELWGTLANFLRCNQVRGIGRQHAKELGARKFFRGTRNRLIAEQKREMKKRTGYSPDVADAANVGVEVARVRLGAVAGAENIEAVQKAWELVAQQHRVNPIRLQSHTGIAHYGRQGRRF